MEWKDSYISFTTGTLTTTVACSQRVGSIIHHQDTSQFFLHGRFRTEQFYHFRFLHQCHDLFIIARKAGNIYRNNCLCFRSNSFTNSLHRNIKIRSRIHHYRFSSGMKHRQRRCTISIGRNDHFIALLHSQPTQHHNSSWCPGIDTKYFFCSRERFYFFLQSLYFRTGCDPTGT